MLLQSSPISTLRLMFVVGRLHDESSGVTRIICDLANALSRQNAQVDVYATHCDGMPTAPHLLKQPSRFIAEPGMWLGGLSPSHALNRTIEHNVQDCDIVHCHSFWMLPNHYASIASRRHGKPLVFTAHGALEPWALARSRWKKRPVAWWWQDGDLRNAACIHVNSRREAAGIRAYGLKNPIAIIPNGIDLEPLDQLPTNKARSTDKKVLLFLSRLHAKKGLSHLLEAWHRVSGDHRDWHLLIAGPDEGERNIVENQIAAMQLQASVTLAGNLQGDAKLKAVAGADAFVLPSFSEGFSMTVLEAMAARLPVLITHGCNFPEAAEANAAIEIEPTADATERALRELFSMSDAQRHDMGTRGRALIERRYTWNAVAREMIELYEWMSGGGPRPSFVRTA